MLVLALKPGEGIVIGDLIHIRVSRQSGHSRLSIDAPKEIVILRDSLPDGRKTAQAIRRRKAAAKTGAA